MTQREHQLSFCEICKNKSFSPSKGIICGITQDLATFDHICSDFDEDPLLKRRSELSNQAKKLEATRESTFGLSSLGIKSGLAAGIVYIVLGIGTVFLTAVTLELITIWSFVLVIIGIILIVKTAIKRSKDKKLRTNHLDLLDEEI